MLGVASLVLLALGLTTDLGGLALTAIFAGGLLQTALYALLLLALVYAGPVLASAGIGRALIDRIRPALGDPPDQPLNAMLFVVVGACVYAGLRVVPWAGPIVGGVGALVGLGALARWLRDAQRLTASDPNDIRGR